MIQPKGSKRCFTGGAEVTPEVEVITFFAPGSLNNGCRTFQIKQNDQVIQLSPATMRTILYWYDH
jgi:hypothetical protein